MAYTIIYATRSHGKVYATADEAIAAFCATRPDAKVDGQHITYMGLHYEVRTAGAPVGSNEDEWRREQQASAKKSARSTEYRKMAAQYGKSYASEHNDEVALHGVRNWRRR